MQTFADALRQHGIDIPGDIIADGRIHRVKADPKDQKRSLWYIAHDDDHPLIRVGNWKGDDAVTIRLDRPMSDQDRRRAREIAAERRRAREQ